MRCPIRYYAAILCYIRLMSLTVMGANSSEPELRGPPFGYELLQSKFAYMEQKFKQLHLADREHHEAVLQELRLLRRSYADLHWTVTQLSQTLGHNISDLREQTWTMVQRQTACANHETLRHELLSIPPRKVQRYPTHDHGTERPLRSCREESGTHLLQISQEDEPFYVYCEQESFCGGWIVIQHRFDGSLDFFRNWTEYRDGFGRVDGEMWLGLERLHRMTNLRQYELAIELKDFDGVYAYARYKRFRIASETDGYRLEELGAYSGNATDSMDDDVDNKFSTFDQDSTRNYRCPHFKHGAWWYRQCSHCNLNGRYGNTTDIKTMSWYGFKTSYVGLRYSRMMIRELLKKNATSEEAWSLL